MAISKKKKSTSTLPFLIGAIGFGIAAALLSVLFLKAKESALIASLTGEEETTVQVVVAAQDLPRGSLVQDGYFSIREVPQEFVHSDVVYPEEYESYKGRSITADLGYGKPLLKSFLDEEFPVDFSDTVQPGRRAMTVSVDEINSVAGFIRPGNHIDIFVNIPYSNSGFNPGLYSVGLFNELPGGVDIASTMGGGDLESLTSELPKDKVTELLGSLAPGDVIIPVLQDVRVLATGKDPYVESLDLLRQPQYRTDTNYSTVTLDVSTDQAALLTAAQDKGDILALLRNRNDKGASSFTTISSRDLFENASKMAAAEKARAGKVAEVAGADAYGNLVGADGRKSAGQDQLAAAGLSVNENGQIVVKDGNIVDPADLVVAADGTVMTKAQLAAAGLSVNASGQIVDKNGNIVSASDLVVAADGSVMTKAQLAAAGLSVNANGEIVDKDGKIVAAEDLILSADGKIISKTQLEAAGLSVNDRGEIVDKDGNVINPDDIIVAADGSILSQEQLAAAGLSVNENGEIVDKEGNVISPDDVVIATDGSVMTKAQLAEAGLSINASGEIVDENGNVVDKDDLMTGPGGTVLSRKQLTAEGYSVNEKGEIVDSSGKVVTAGKIAEIAKSQKIRGMSAEGPEYEFIIGGASEDGVPKSKKLKMPN